MSMRSLFGGIVADSPVPLVSRWESAMGRAGSMFGARSLTGDLKALNATPVLFGVVTKLAQMTAAPEWHLCQKSADPDDEPTPLSGARAENAAPLKVLNSPNAVPHMNRTYLFRALQQHKDLCGEFYMVVVKIGGMPVELWPVRPDRMFPVPSTTKLVAGYVYRSPDGEEIPLDVGQVLTSIWPSTTDPLRGQGPIGALAMDLAQNDAQSSWNASLYRNSANPGGIIKTERRLSDTEWDQLVERWRMNHQGTHNAGRVAVLEEADFIPLSYTQRDMQFVETRGLTKQAILDGYGFPKFGLGDVDDVNRASADASLTLMAQRLVVPRLNDWRDLLNSRYLPMFGSTWKNYTFEYESPIPPDAESERLDLKVNAEAFAVLTGAGVHEDDAAEICRLPKMRFEKPEPVQLGQSGGYEQDKQTDSDDVTRDPEKDRRPRRRRPDQEEK